MADAPGQARTTVGQVAQYVTILMGANDLCGWDGTLTPTATFRAQFAETLDILRIYNFAFTRTMVSKLDYFHPSLSGQATLSALTWDASWWGS